MVLTVSRDGPIKPLWSVMVTLPKFPFLNSHPSVGRRDDTSLLRNCSVIEWGFICHGDSKYNDNLKILSFIKLNMYLYIRNYELFYNSHLNYCKSRTFCYFQKESKDEKVKIVDNN